MSAASPASEAGANGGGVQPSPRSPGEGALQGSSPGWPAIFLPQLSAVRRRAGEGKHLLNTCCVLRGQGQCDLLEDCIRRLYEFPVAAVTDGHKQHGLKQVLSSQF